MAKRVREEPSGSEQREAVESDKSNPAGVTHKTDSFGIRTWQRKGVWGKE
jgi:hypothetical protein